MNESSCLLETTLGRPADIPSRSFTCKKQGDRSKRSLDISLSAIALCLLGPCLLVIALLIRLNSPGKALFAQVRVGKEGRLFKCYKFRTMHQDADKRLAEILRSDPASRLEWTQTQKLRQDPRITGRLGRLLRKSSLDEFPQFWNVLKGDLSLVGPRPMLSSEVQQRLGRRAAKILSVKPGLTGIWQTCGRSQWIDYEQRILMDEAYVDRRNFWLDCKLIAKTVPCMLFGRGA